MAKKVHPSAAASGPNALQWATLAGVVLVGAFTMNNRQAISAVQQSVDSKISSIDARVAKMQSDVASATAAARQAQQPQRRGPDPNQAYTLKPPPPSLAHGNPSAPITIVEVSDFQ